MGKGKRRGVLAFMISLVMVFGSFSLAFADENGVSESYGDGYYDGLLQDEDGYISDEYEVVYDHEEYSYDDVEDYLSQEMQEAEGIESVGLEAGIVPAWGFPVQEGNRISAGGFSSFVIMPDNSLWGWGAGPMLGEGTGQDRFSPVRIRDNVVAISAGFSHTMAISAFGELLAWGHNTHGQLGDGTTDFQLNPVWVMDGVIAVSAGFSHTMAITNDGSLWAWGSNRGGQLGDGTTIDRHSPVWIMGNAMAVSAGKYHTEVITFDGSLWTLGINGPVQVGSNMVSVSASGEYTMALRFDGVLWGWGRNNLGQLGNGTTFDSSPDTPIMDDVVAVSARNGDGLGGHTMAIRTDGSLWGWGNNSHGQLGNGTSSSGLSSPNPNPMEIMDNVVEVSIGFQHTIAIMADGSLWGWGYNRQGQVGDDTGIDRNSPVFIKSLSATNTPDPDRNLALDATMSARSSQGIRTPDRANNGIRFGAATDSWSADDANQQWLEINFGEQRNFNHIRIYQGGNRITDYFFAYSSDGVNWTEFRYGERIMEATPVAYHFTHPSTIQAQFVRLVSGRSIGVTPIVVFEFEVYYLP